jgi:membrane protease subunit HflC
MQAYETSMKAGDTRVLMSPQSSDFFRYLTDPKGGKAAAAPAEK